MILRITEVPDGRFHLVHYSKEAAQHWTVVTNTRAEAEAVADKLGNPAPPMVRGDALHAREPHYVVTSVSQYARHYVEAGAPGPPFKSLCGRDLGPVTLHPETEAEVSCPVCRRARRERMEWTA